VALRSHHEEKEDSTDSGEHQQWCVLDTLRPQRPAERAKQVAETIAPGGDAAVTTCVHEITKSFVHALVDRAERPLAAVR
jgi:hypothetical protein